jgi:MFS transporter, FHS family, L-fucose permease
MEQSIPTKSYYGPLAIIGVLFFCFGFVTWVNGTLIAFFKSSLSLTNTQSLLVTFAFFISYFVMAIPSSWVLRATGFKNGMSIGLLVMAVGAILFVPAANSQSYELFLLGLFLIGTGLALLQTASNPYATILGPRESAAQRISILGVANKTAGIIAQVIFGSILLGTTATVEANPLQKVVTPYIIISVVLVILAGLIRFSNLPEVNEEDDNSTTTAKSRSSVWAYPNLVLGVLALFFYVGAEVIAGDTIINYGVSQGFSLDEAKLFGTYTLYAMLAGYIAGIIFIPKYLSQQMALRLSALSGFVFTAGIALTSGFTSVLFVAMLGLSNALVWPAVWPLALQGLGKFTKIGSAMLIMAIAGGALLPLLYGKIADATSTQQAYWLMGVCYVYILYYALSGHKKSSW